LRLPDAKTRARPGLLSPAAKQILTSLPRLPGNPWVFPGRVRGIRLRTLNASWQVSVCIRTSINRSSNHHTTDPTRGLMDNSGTNREHDVPDALWAVLSGHRWHATSLDGLRGIVDSGAIEIRPGYNGLCKSLGAVSLFDFGPTAVDIKSGGHWKEWCGSQQAASARATGVPQKRVGVWLRVRDDYADDRLIDAGSLRKIWKETEGKPNIIPGVEGGHRGPLAVAELDQIVVIGALDLPAYRVWDAMPSTEVLEEVSDHIDNLPAEPLCGLELAYFRARQNQ